MNNGNGDKGNELQIDPNDVSQIAHYTRKWNISVRQLFEAITAAKSFSLEKVKSCLRERGLIK